MESWSENHSAEPRKRLASRRRLRLSSLAVAVVAVVAFYSIGASQTSTLVTRAIELVSVSIFGTSGNNASNGPAVNVDGNFVAFWSDATNLVVGDTNQFRDVYLRSRLVPPSTQRVSVNDSGIAGNGPSHAQGGAPAIDGPGHMVAFYSTATNLVPDDTNGFSDVFVRNVDNLSTTLVSLNSNQEQANGPSLYPSMSADARFVAFQSAATNLVPDDTNGQVDIFVRDRMNNTTERLCNTTPANGFSITPAISADGNVVAFASNATNLIPNDNNNRIDIFVCDRRTNAITVVSINNMGVLGNGDSILPAIDQDGTVVAFKSIASNLVPDDRNGVVDVFARDLTAMQTERISVNFAGGDPNEGSFPPSVDYSGRFVAFGSSASNLVPNDFNNVSSVFVRDRTQDLTFLVDVNERGEQANNGTLDVPPSISGNAQQIGFVSLASNLAPNDTTTIPDVFITRNPFTCDVDEDCPEGFECETGFCVMKGTPTPTPTASTDDCCQCGAACQDPSAEGCPTDCEIVRSAACANTTDCVTFTPTAAITPTPTATAGPNDCCQCTGPACQNPTAAGCPTDCQIVPMAACIDTNCATFTPTVEITPTPTATAGPNDCCQCTGPACENPTAEGCPTDCQIVPMAACIDNVNCATFTPTPTATAGPNDCCQCTGPACENPTAEGCPTDCQIVRMAACIDNVNCATFTPTATATATPTAGADDCCQCPNDMCEAPGNDGCPTTCEIVRMALCSQGSICQTFTPTPEITPTPTAGPSDCCQCSESTCEAPGNDGCPTGCQIRPNAACIGGARCATFTPTPTARAIDCCQCTVGRCEAPGNDGCPTECETVLNAVCINNTNCATVTPSGSVTVTATVTPSPTGGTPTATANATVTATGPTGTATSGTATPTRGGGTPTPTFSPNRPDKDGCNCTIVSDSPDEPVRVPTWLAGPVALMLWRRRYLRRAGQ